MGVKPESVWLQDSDQNRGQQLAKRIPSFEMIQLYIPFESENLDYFI